jgi:hypothetical protein
MKCDSKNIDLLLLNGSACSEVSLAIKKTGKQA